LGEPQQLQYHWVGCLGAHLERALTIVPREQLHVIVQDDLSAEPERVYRGLLEFLSLPPHDTVEFPRVNVSKRSRSVLFQSLLYRPPRVLRWAGRVLTRVIDPKHVHAVLGRLRRLNRRDQPPTPLSPAARQEMVAAFEEDVALLSRLLGRDLSGWLSE